MNTMPIKGFRHWHMQGTHHVAERMDHLLHDERVWGVLALIALLALLVLSIMIGGSMGAGLPFAPPYMYGY